MSKNKPANPLGGPRQKLMRVMRQSGVADSAATRLTEEALGKQKKKKKKKASGTLRKQIISRLQEIGAKARAKNPVSKGLRAGYKAGKKLKR